MKKINIRNIVLAFGIVGLSIAFVFADELAENGKGYTISAQTNLEANSLVILSKITDTRLENIDTVIISENGVFNFEGMASDESILYYITFGTTQPPGIPIVLENGAKVNMNITKDVSYNLEMTGGKYNSHMVKLFKIYTGYENKMAAFNSEVAKIDPASATEELREETTARYNMLMQSRSTDIQSFVANEEASPATYFAIKYLFNQPEPKLVILWSKVMSSQLPNSTYTLNLVTLANSYGPTIEGAMAPEINLKTPEGETLALSSLRGKVVLIDFWASWCGPCRKENPNVKIIYDKYKDKGFEIYGVSLDNNGDQWKAAIAKDGLGWKHVSDLGGWKSSAAQLYQVHSIPQTFLLDKEGRIVKSGFRSHELETLLQDLLD